MRAWFAWCDAPNAWGIPVIVGTSEEATKEEVIALIKKEHPDLTVRWCKRPGDQDWRIDENSGPLEFYLLNSQSLYEGTTHE